MSLSGFSTGASFATAGAFLLPDIWKQSPKGRIDQYSRAGGQTFEYKYDVHTIDGLFGFFARFRRGFYVLGFAVADVKTLRDDPEIDGEWIAPRELLATNPHFSKKHG
jgi:hypothetical protein